MIKIFVLDTNVLLHDADSLKKFEDNIIILSITVIEELDTFKDGNREIHRNARHVSRFLAKLMERGKLHKGIKTDSGGLIKTELNCIKPTDDNFAALNLSDPDNRILLVAHTLNKIEKKKGKKGKKVIFVSKDINARIKADALGLDWQDYDSDKVNIDELYAGWREILVDGDLINGFFEQKELEFSGKGLLPHEFVLLKDAANPKHSGIGRYFNGVLYRLNDNFSNIWEVREKNKEQRMAMEILMNPDIELVTLVGQAGTGKTLLALAAGLQSVFSLDRYEKISVLRPIIPLGKDLGYMPGDKDEKLHNWMKPIFDNLAFLMEKRSGIGKDIRQESAASRVKMLFDQDFVELEALTYVRGRSIPRQYIIVDEAQNLTPHEAKTIITRAGEGTKIILTGDPYQIDNPYLDSSSNGLTYTVEMMREEGLHAHITLKKSERSGLATAAANRM